jgi:hypothetical protein
LQKRKKPRELAARRSRLKAAGSAPTSLATKARKDSSLGITQALVGLGESSLMAFM